MKDNARIEKRVQTYISKIDMTKNMCVNLQKQNIEINLVELHSSASVLLNIR